MKINNEVKIGILVLVAIACLIFGIRMLQGKGLFESGIDIYAFYEDASGLQTSSPVLLKGVQIGRVKDIQLEKDSKIKVTLHINSGYDIPTGSEAELAAPSLISSDKVINIHLPESSNSNLKDADIIPVKASSDLLSSLGGEVKPVIANVNGTIGTIDSVALAVNNILNLQTQMHLHNTFANVDKAVDQLAQLSSELNKQTTQLNQIMQSLNSFAGNLSKNNSSVTNILSNVEKTTHTLSGPELESTLKSIQKSTEELNKTLAKMNSKDGSLGMLVNDAELYNNLTKLSKTLDEMMADMKKNPGKYLNISVF